jgi:hypothetical protein
MNDAIYDLLGEEILPGCLISYASGNIMEIAIVSNIKPEELRLNFLMKSRRKLYKTEWVKRPRGKRKKPRLHKRRTFAGYTDWKIRTSWIKLEDEEIQNRIVVIKNPFFHMDNPNVAKQLEIVDMAKDQGLIPEEYVLGMSLQDLNIEE